MKLALWLALGLIAADAPIFSWMDDKGALHATDRLGDVPEPYYSMYAARLKELEERQKHAEAEPMAPVVEPTAPPRPSVEKPVVIPSTQQEAARREAWKQTMKQWRLELANAMTALQAVDQHIQQVSMNPVMAQTPQVKEQVQDLEYARQRASQRVLTARNMLLDVLPKRARDEHVPPLWLM